VWSIYRELSSGSRGIASYFEELVQVFKTECPRTIKELRRAVSTHDIMNLERHAHALKGSSANLGASSVSQAAFDLEKMARSTDIGGADELLKMLEREVDHLFCELQAFSAK